MWLALPTETVMNNTFKEIEDITDVRRMTNEQLKKIIQKNRSGQGR